MPLSAYVFYLESKYKHEIVRDIYQMDMLRFAAFGMVEEKNRPPRYWEMLRSQEANAKSAEAVTGKNYDEHDIVAMFLGEGKLV